MQERRATLGERLVAVTDDCVDVEAAATRVGEGRADQQLGVDGHRAAVADEDACRHRRERVPRGEQADRLVERAGNETAVDDPGTALMSLVEREVRLVLLEARLGGQRQVQARRVVAAPPALRVVVRRDVRQSVQTFSNVPNRSSCT